MSVQVRYGMVGGHLDAFIGNVHRLAQGFDPRAALVAGCFSVVPKENEDAAEAFNVDRDRLYADYREMAEKESKREDGIDLVSITTPNFLHYEIAKCFLQHGINVVCEKPLCFTVKEAQELKKLAEKNDLIFAVTYTYPGYAMVKVMREMVRKGKIGNICAVNAEYAQDWLLDELGRPNDGTAKLGVWRSDPKKSGISNCVGDIGTHIEYAVHYVTGLNIKRLSATVNRYGKPLDLNANMLVEYEGGVNGAYWCSQVAAGKLNGLVIRVYGSEGSLEWEQHYPDYLKYTPKGKPTETLSRGCGYIKEKAGAFSRLPCGHPEGLYIAFANIYKEVNSAIIKKKSGKKIKPGEFDYPTVDDGLEGVKFVQAVIESGDNDSKWVKM